MNSVAPYNRPEIEWERSSINSSSRLSRIATSIDAK
jgi:hypothetical protein